MLAMQLTHKFSDMDITIKFKANISEADTEHLQALISQFIGTVEDAEIELSDITINAES